MEYKRATAEDYFVDNVISSMTVDPLYQSNGYAIALIPVSTIQEDRDNILQYMAQCPTEGRNKLKDIVENIKGTDSSGL